MAPYERQVNGAANSEMPDLRRPSLGAARRYGRRYEDSDAVRGIRVHRPGGPEVLRIEEIPTPAPRPGWVRIRVRVFGTQSLRDIHAPGHSPGVQFRRVLGIDCVGGIDHAGGTDLDDIPSAVRLTVYHSRMTSADGALRRFRRSRMAWPRGLQGEPPAPLPLRRDRRGPSLHGREQGEREARGRCRQVKQKRGDRSRLPRLLPHGGRATSRALPTLSCCPTSVARDGIEPPTRGFSVRCSTN